MDTTSNSDITSTFLHAKKKSYAHPSDHNTAVKSIEAITDDLYQGRDLIQIRIAIADLMEHHLQRGKDIDNQEALPYFINALGSLTLNIHSKKRSSPVGLYPCLIDLENAIAMLDGKNSRRFRLYEKSVEQITYEFLIDALETIRRSPSFMGQH